LRIEPKEGVALSSDQSSQLLLARQPIFDRNTKVVAYELLFREVNPERADVVDGDFATSAVLENAFMNLSIDDVIGDHKAFINFTPRLLEMEIPIEPARCVIEVLEDVEVTDALLESLKRAKQKGHLVALDDFEYNEALQPLVDLADIIKLDVLALTDSELVDAVGRLSAYGVTLLAEKIETNEMLRHCLDLGFEMFQGNFLSKPEPITGRKLAANKIVVLELLTKLQEPSSNFKDLELLISQDPALGLKTLRLVNSAYYGPRHQIESLSHAIAYLGMDALRSLASLLVVSGLSDKPDALRDFALERAKFCELLGRKVKEAEASVFYSVGLLSTMDAYFDQPLEEILGNMSLRPDVKAALLDREGELGAVLALVERVQRGELEAIVWDRLADFDLSPQVVNELYMEVIQWQRQVSVELEF
jgi:EAL and modified HD-GYP domain-containing signal transduction protein